MTSTLLLMLAGDAHMAVVHRQHDHPAVLLDAVNRRPLRPNAIGLLDAEYWAGQAALLAREACSAKSLDVVNAADLADAAEIVSSGSVAMGIGSRLALLLRKAIAESAPRGYAIQTATVIADDPEGRLDRHGLERWLSDILLVPVTVQATLQALETLLRNQDKGDAAAFAVLLPNAVFVGRRLHGRVTLQRVATCAGENSLQRELRQIAGDGGADPWAASCLWSAYLAWLGKLAAYDDIHEPFEPALVDARFHRCAVSVGRGRAALAQIATACDAALAAICAGMPAAAPMYCFAGDDMLQFWQHCCDRAASSAGLDLKPMPLNKLVCELAMKAPPVQYGSKAESAYGLLMRPSPGAAKQLLRLVDIGTPLPGSGQIGIDTDQSAIRLDIGSADGSGAVTMLRQLQVLVPGIATGKRRMNIELKVFPGSGLRAIVTQSDTSQVAPLHDSRVAADGGAWISGPEVIASMSPNLP